jgi:hypothetical protein
MCGRFRALEARLPVSIEGFGQAPRWVESDGGGSRFIAMAAKNQLMEVDIQTSPASHLDWEPSMRLPSAGEIAFTIDPANRTATSTVQRRPVNDKIWPTVKLPWGQLQPT